MIRFITRLLGGLATLFGAAAAARNHGETFVAAPASTRQPPASDETEQPSATSLGGLQHDARAPLRPGWNRLQPEKLPRPTYWPAIVALGVAVTMWGVIANAYLWVMGLLLLIAGATGWVRELVAEGAEEVK